MRDRVDYRPGPQRRGCPCAARATVLPGKLARLLPWPPERWAGTAPAAAFRASAGSARIVTRRMRTGEVGLESWQFVIVGGGIAGISAAAHIAALGRTLILEREDAPGRHSTARSAALYYRNYGAPGLRRLTAASEPFFRQPPEGFAAVPLVRARGVLTLARPGEAEQLERYRTDPLLAGSAVPVPVSDAVRRVPILKAASLAAALWEADAADLDVDLLLQGFRRVARAAGAELRTDAEFLGAAHTGSGWRVATSRGELSAAVLVDAAGAWADLVATRSGVRPVGLTPKRRTALRIAAPAGHGVADWPMVHDVGERFYFKPDAGCLLLSLAEEADSEPCDAWAEDEDVALAIERAQEMADLPVQRPLATWAGLRTFTPDRDAAIGFDPEQPDFFWLAGQGGAGIQSAPAAARLAAALIQHKAVPDELLAHGVDAGALDPARFRRGRGTPG